VIGQRLARVDARERVTGEARYPADLALPGMVHARHLRSPHAHARIRRIDTTRRPRLRGVLAVVTAADFVDVPVGATIPMGETGYDMWMVAQINMARHRVFWVGQPVAAVGRDGRTRRRGGARADRGRLRAVAGGARHCLRDRARRAGAARACAHQGRRAAPAHARAMSARAP
jgi:CO/xanthine dehydrogenase Mo-binding subunit